MARGRAGDRGEITMMFETHETSVVVGDSSISEFSLDITMMGIPTGSAIVTVDTSVVNGISSDIDGVLSIVGMDGSEDGVVYTMHIMSISRTILSNNMVNIAFSFILGNRKFLANMENFAVEGTSVAAMKTILSRHSVEFSDRATNAGTRPTDAQIWRFVDGSLVDHLNSVAAHSCVSGDYLFWTVDDETSEFRISSIESERPTSSSHILAYSQDSGGRVEYAKRETSNPDCTCWTYVNYVPIDITGSNITDINPNFIIDTFDTDGKKDIGACSDGCWPKILDSFKVPYVASSVNQVFGDKDLVRPFPNNTHKSYSVATYVRNALFATYNKVIHTAIYNTFGPKVGEMVKFIARKPDAKAGDTTPDGYYTDEYLVVSKSITKNSEMPVGLIGRTETADNTDLVVQMTLVSNNTGSNETSACYKDAVSAMKKFNEVYNART